MAADWGIVELGKHNNAGNKLSGSSILHDDDAVEALAGAADNMANNNSSLVDSKTTLAKSNTTLTDANSKQANHIVELLGLLQRKEEELEACKLAHPPTQWHNHNLVCLWFMRCVFLAQRIHGSLMTTHRTWWMIRSS